MIVRIGEVRIGTLNQTGPVMVEAGGTLRLLDNASISDLRLQGGTLRLYTSSPGYTLTSTITIEKPSTIQAGSVAATVFTLAGTIKGSSDITKNGLGVLEVSSSAAGFTGNWIVTEGTLRIKSLDALGKCGIKVAAGAVLNIATPSAASVYSLVIDSLGKVNLDQSLNTEVAVLGKENIVLGSYNASTRPLFIGSTGTLAVKYSILTASGSLNLCAGSSVQLNTATSTTYSWKNGTTQVGTAQAYTANTAGDYNVSLSNANSCKVTSANATVKVNALPTATISTTTPTAICQGGSVVLTASTGTSYKWFNGTTQVGTAQTYTATIAGNFTVEVTNASGCKAISVKTTVTVNALPIATITNATSTTICNGGSVVLTSSTGASYKWFNGTTQVGTGSSYTATTVGSYTVEVTNASGCKTTSSGTSITVNALPTATISTTTPTTLCTGESVVLTSSAGSSYKWFNGTTQVATTQSYTASTAGDYTVEVTNANGCKATSTKTTVALNAAPVATISATGSTTLCSGESVVLTSSAGSSYKWFNGTTQIGTSQSYTATTAGDYSVEVTGANGCKATSGKTTVTLNTAGTATIVESGSTALCQGESVVLSFSTGTSYKWFNGTTQVGTNQTYTATTAGDYTAEVTNANGCKVTSNKLTVTVNSLPTAIISASTPTSICDGQSVVLYSSPGSTYKWFNGTTQVGTIQTYAATTAGDYSVEVSNANGCKATSAKTTVTVSASPTATITSLTPTSLCSGESVTLTSSAGSSYKWYNGTQLIGTSQTYSTVAAGDYLVEVTNASGCKSISAKTTVTVNASPTAAITTATPTTLCDGESVVLTASTGSSYKWYNGATEVGTGQTFTATTAGDYSVEVTNANNCKAVSSKTIVTIGAMPIATISTGGSTIVCSGEGNVLTSSVGSSYKWYKGTTLMGTSQTYAATSAGEYSVEVTNASGCKATSSVVTLEAGIAPTPSIVADGPTTFCEGESVMLTSSDGLTFNWYNGTTLVEQDQIFTATASGNYTVEVVYDNGCKAVSGEIIVDVTPCGLTAVGAGRNELIVQVFPNPFIAEFEIQQNGQFSYQLYDSKGSLVASGEATDKVLIGEDLSKGLYLLRIESFSRVKTTTVVKE